MPQLHNVKVQVYSEGKLLNEYGTQHQGKQNIKSTYIESKADKAFTILIQPKVPWDYSEAGSASPQYSLVAEVYFDGKDEPERRSVVYLDPHHPEAPGDCRLWLRHRWTRTADGALREHKWIFKERGVENALGRLTLTAAATSEPDEEDMLSGALSSASLSQRNDTTESEARLGQIVVLLFRATISASYFDPKYFSAKSSIGDDKNMDSSDPDIVHTAQSIATGTTSYQPSQVVDLRRFRPEMGHYAEFRFLYRTKDQLAKMGLGNFPAQPSRLNYRKLQANNLISMTPLSFSESSRQSVSRKRTESGPSYEEKIQKGSFASNDNIETPAFHDYRSPNAKKRRDVGSPYLRRSQRLQNKVGQKPNYASSNRPERGTASQRTQQADYRDQEDRSDDEIENDNDSILETISRGEDSEAFAVNPEESGDLQNKLRGGLQKLRLKEEEGVKRSKTKEGDSSEVANSVANPHDRA